MTRDRLISQTLRKARTSRNLKVVSNRLVVTIFIGSSRVPMTYDWKYLAGHLKQMCKIHFFHLKGVKSSLLF